MPWVAVEKAYVFDGPEGKASLLDLFQGRRQLIVYRAFFEPGVHGWPEHACVGCSLVADQVSHLAHLNARDTTLVYASRAPQADIARLKARMGWEIPWYTITDSFDADFGVSKPAISKHLKVLEETGVVSRVVEGRTHRLSLEPEVLDEAAEWMDRQRALWERMFDVVDEYLKEEPK